MRKKLKFLAPLAALLVALTPTWAYAVEARTTVEDVDVEEVDGVGEVTITTVETTTDTDNEENTETTNSIDATSTTDFSTVSFGSNLFVTGINVQNDSQISGIVFAAGNQLDLANTANYSFVAGNVVDYKGSLSRDLFIAGNIVRIDSAASIGGDVYAAGTTIELRADLSGNISATADKIILGNVMIAGDVNLYANQIEFSDSTLVAGTLNYNENATLVNINEGNLGGITTYAVETKTETLGSFLMGKIMSLLSIFLIATAFILLIPRTKAAIFNDVTLLNIGKIILYGFGFLCIVPIVVVVLLMTVFAYQAALFLLAIYILAIILAQVFAAIWLGYLLVEIVMRRKLPVVVEGLIGAVAYVCILMIPLINTLLAFVFTIIGLGLLVHFVRPLTSKKSTETAAKKDLDNPFRNQKSLEKSVPKVKATAKK